MDKNSVKELPHIYRNRPDDNREPEDLSYCSTCNGFYGVPHTVIHEKRTAHPTHGPRSVLCACRPCRELESLSREGRYGFILSRREANQLLPATPPTRQD